MFKLCVMVRLLREVSDNTKLNLFMVEFIPWKSFLNAMLDRKGNSDLWTRMSQADCLIGGVDTSISYL
jgi:hypothetical protein